MIIPDHIEEKLQDIAQDHSSGRKDLAECLEIAYRAGRKQSVELPKIKGKNADRIYEVDFEGKILFEVHLQALSYVVAKNVEEAKRYIEAELSYADSIGGWDITFSPAAESTKLPETWKSPSIPFGDADDFPAQFWLERIKRKIRKLRKTRTTESKK